MRKLVDFANEMVLKRFDAKVVRRSTPSEAESPGMDKRVIFFHPPKCGGTSINSAFLKIFSTAKGRYVFELDAAASRLAAEQLGCSMVEMRESILAYAVQKSSLRYISGHFPFSNRAVNGSGDWQFMTVLREPVSRTLSLYYYNRYRNAGRNHFGIETELAQWLETDEALSAGSIYLRMFMGDVIEAEALALPGVSSDARTQATVTAIGNLEQFAIVGLLEDLEAYGEDVARHCGVELLIPHKNKSPSSRYPSFDEHPIEIREKLLEICEADSAIYKRFNNKSSDK